VLARANRVTSGADYRRISRRGRRANAAGLVAIGEANRDSATPTRFGFIITKRVGVAVVRNRTRRRLKAITHELLLLLPTGASFVIRVFPEAASLSYEQLRRETRRAVLDSAGRLGMHTSGVEADDEFCSCSDATG
jgi:ribonuclease P protein component